MHRSRCSFHFPRGRTQRTPSSVRLYLGTAAICVVWTDCGRGRAVRSASRRDDRRFQDRRNNQTSSRPVERVYQPRRSTSEVDRANLLANVLVCLNAYEIPICSKCPARLHVRVHGRVNAERDHVLEKAFAITDRREIDSTSTRQAASRTTEISRSSRKPSVARSASSLPEICTTTGTSPPTTASTRSRRAVEERFCTLRTDGASLRSRVISTT